MEAIPFHRPYIGTEEEEAVIRVLRSGWLTTGVEALAFEKEFAEFLSQSPDPQTEPLQSEPLQPQLFCLAVNSATSGLHLALEAVGVGPGDAVFIPSYTFTATAEVVRYLGAEAVFVDITPDSYNMDPIKLEAAISSITQKKQSSNAASAGLRPRAVIPVHIGGLPCDMEAISGIARRYGLAVVEDAAHAFPARMPDAARWAGTCGDAGVFSFYASKTITTGEGGMVVTAREELARRIQVMRSHGIDRPVWNRYTDTAASWFYEVVAPGFKYNLPDLLAAVGRVQLRRAMSLLEMRLAIAQRYDRAFENEPALTIPPSGGARHLYTLRFKEPSQRDSFIEYLRDQGIGTSVHFIPLHIMPYYRERYGLQPEDLPESYKRFKETVSLPIWPGMSGEQTDRVIEAVLCFVGRHRSANP
jgi:dTDP-4-amino-4,6-dideoxygalactose transaminase